MPGRRFAMCVAPSIAGLISVLLLAGCGPSPTQEPTEQPTPESAEQVAAVVKTTAKELDSSAVATVTANPLFDIPDGKYLLLQARDSARFCSANCACATPDPTNWSALSLGEQGQAMRGMIQQGARGFLDVVEGASLRPCSCVYNRERWEPITLLPFVRSFEGPDGEFELTVYSVDRTGVIVAKMGDATYIFKAGDMWSYHYTNPDPGPSPSECLRHLVSQEIYFENGGLVDESQLPALSIPTATPAPTAMLAFWPTGMPRPTRGPTAILLVAPTDEASCQRAGGHWTDDSPMPHGEDLSCLYVPTADAGRPCSDESECQGWCDPNLDFVDAVKLTTDASTSQPVLMTGTCSRWAFPSQCCADRAYLLDGELKVKLGLE